MDNVFHFSKRESEPLPEKTVDRRTQRDWIKVWILRALIFCGFVALFYYFSWWFVDFRFTSPGLTLLLVCAVCYAGTQMAGNWLLYLAARKPTVPAPLENGLTTDVYVTACGEDYWMIERTLAAAVGMRGEHRTWLLDDGGNLILKDLAERLGAGYLSRPDRKDAKAGNLNAALPRTDGDIIAIFDIDHVPAPDFLERSLGHFANPRLGFVQVMLTFANKQESWVAQAAMETSLEFYNPTSLGADGVGGATLMGSNALIRRKALEKIGGYQPGLAEDLATSIALHASGWQSAYVAEPLAPGLAPPSFIAWFVQQLKWARGVFELLLTVYPRVFSRLTGGQRLSYAVRMTKYWIGPVIGLHLFATIAVLIFGGGETRAMFHDYLIQITPLAMADVLIRYQALRTWRHPSTPRTSLSRAVVLVYATWPIYLQAWLMAVLRLPVNFRPTPKSKSGRLNFFWMWPQVTVIIALLLGTLYTVIIGGHQPSILLVFAILQGAVQLMLFTQWMRTDFEMPKAVSRSLAVFRELTRPVGINRRMIKNQIQQTITGLQNMIENVPVDLIEQTVAILHRARLEKRRIFILSNQRNGMVAEWFISELNRIGKVPGWPEFQVVGRSRRQANLLSGLSRQPEPWRAKPVQAGEVVIAIFDDSLDREIIRVLEAARARQAKTIAMARFEANQLFGLADIILDLPNDPLGEFTEAQILLVRIMIEALRDIGRLRSFGDAVPAEPLGVLTEQSGAAPEAELAGPFFFNGSSIHQMHYRKILRACMEAASAASGSILLVNEGEQACEVVVAYKGRIESYVIDHLTEAHRSSLAGWVLEHRQPALVTDTYADERWIWRAWDEIHGARSAISVPMMLSSRMVGVLTLVHPNPQQFSQSDLVSLVETVEKALALEDSNS
jgi:cellulose synthase (UDP-forming)